MNKYSRIERAKNLAFQWKASNTDQSEITQILQSAPNGQSVGLKAKVLFKGDKETVYSKHAKKNLTKCDIFVYSRPQISSTTTPAQRATGGRR